VATFHCSGLPASESRQRVNRGTLISCCRRHVPGLELFAHISARDFAEFLEIQGEVLLAIMEIGRAEGIRRALPSQMTYLTISKAAEG
jgi:hypothetical protein